LKENISALKENKSALKINKSALKMDKCPEIINGANFHFVTVKPLHIE
jgi:hypothetical protein